MTYKMLVIDVDDTLLTSEHVISPKTHQALMEFQDAGNTLVLASGRPNQGMQREMEALELAKYNSYIVAFNGAVLVRANDKEQVFKQTLDIEDQNLLIPFLQDNGLTVLTYNNGTIVMDHPNDYSHIESELTGLPDIYDPDYINNLNTPQIKFIGVGDPDIVGALEDQLGGRFGQATNANTSKSYYLELFHKDVSKGITVSNLATHLGFSIDEVVAVGDGNNDASMIQMAGVGVAMGNASKELQEKADFVTYSNDEDGIVHVIKRYF